ncbi:protein kinase [Thermobifida halotolerans]|uniref:non-specific serine/threonine protein kinase n=1 Tax=Thermobifida halotolerans TaxID=483545 RepID=A0AA97M3N8_9ACTN|nr:serine/threonine-protein kinase [Thermobifida halotolerans]UOE19166.1 protein kinase [Thermobifida halotolerans]
MDRDAVRALAVGLVEGLAAIQEAGLVHRDLKPGNIILAADGPRIIDFGVTRPLDASTLTESGVSVGTLAYMSPEQVEERPAVPASDVFSLGTVLAFAATGRCPFAADSMAGTVMRIIGPPPELPELSDDLRRLVHNCWTRQPERRPTTTDLLAWLDADRARVDWPPPHIGDLIEGEATGEPDHFRHGAGALPEPDPPGRSSPDRRGKRQRLLGAAVAVPVVVLVAVLLVWLWRPLVVAVSGVDLTAPSNAPVNSPVLGDPLVIDLEQQVFPVAFAPDSSVLASGHPDGTVRLRDAGSGEPVTVLEGHANLVNSLAFAPDGTVLASGSEDGTVRLWPLEPVTD